MDLSLATALSGMGFGLSMLTLFLLREVAHLRERRELLVEIRRMARLIKSTSSVETGIMEEIESPTPAVFGDRNVLSEKDLQAFHDRPEAVKLDKVDRSLNRGVAIQRRRA